MSPLFPYSFCVPFLEKTKSPWHALTFLQFAYTKKLSITKKAFKHNNVCLLKTSIEEVTDVTQFNSFENVEKLALKLIHIRIVVTDNTILNLSLILENNFIFRNKSRHINGNDKMKNIRLSSQCQCTFICVLQKLFTKTRDILLKYKYEIYRALRRKF